ncbi:MAG: Zn-ribbon domain-containing OB-fold protein [Thaumarchaeota archaeon]|nr:Zn-ribbon domain-containing OB-fold protein [Nitrososphaerota archaeon]
MSQPTSFRTEFTLQSFFKRLNEEGKLTGVSCKSCRATMSPPRPVCSRCLSTDLEWLELPKVGRIVAFSEIHVANDAFQSSVPYVVAIAELGEIKVPGIVKGAEIGQLRVGSNIRVETREASARESSTNDLSQPAYWFRLVS